MMDTEGDKQKTVDEKSSKDTDNLAHRSSRKNKNPPEQEDGESTTNIVSQYLKKQRGQEDDLQLSDPNMEMVTISPPTTDLDMRTGPTTGTFFDRITQSLVIVDKTDLLHTLITKEKGVCVLGPRRFGKSFDLSTVHAIFSQGKEWWLKNCTNFAICHIRPEYSFDVHPILHLDFSFASTPNGLKKIIYNAIKRLIHGCVLSESLSKNMEEWKQHLDNTEKYLLSFSHVITKFTENCGKGIVVLIDEYDTPIAHVMQRVLEKGIFPDWHQNKEITELSEFMKKFFTITKSLRQSIPTVIKFEYLTGILPLSHLDLFSGPNSLFITRNDVYFSTLLGFTMREIQTTFEKHLKSMARKVYGLDPKDKILNESEIENKLKNIQEGLICDIAMNYNGYIFHPEQTDSLYSPFSMNSLFNEWISSPKPDYNPHFANSGSSGLIWIMVQAFPFITKLNFFWGLINEQNDEMIAEVDGNQLTCQKEIENIFQNPVLLLYFSGIFSVQKQGGKDKGSQSMTKIIKLGIVSNEMRLALLEDIDSQLKLQEISTTTLMCLTKQDYELYFKNINDNLKILSAFSKSSSNHVKDDNEVEAYTHTLFAFVHTRLEAWNKKEQCIKTFGYIKDKAVTMQNERPDNIIYFDVEDTKIALIIEFKCKNNIGQALKEAYNDLVKKNQHIINNLNYSYDYLKSYKKIWIAGAVGHGIIKSLDLYNLNEINELVRSIEIRY